MASQGYRDWLKAGKPYHLIRPADDLVNTLRRYGLTVYHYPNDAHLQANTPEDHTPFSVTGWPSSNARWNARGVDVMPRGDTAAARKENADIARQLIRDRDAGLPGVAWVKYINWTDERDVCLQERWTDPAAPNRRTTRSSSDKGHIHISGRSDVDDDDRAEDYDPIARMRGGALAGDDDMTPDQAATLARIDGRVTTLLYNPLTNAWNMKGEPNKLREQLDRLERSAAADETRDKALQASIDAMAAALTAGGGDFDTAALFRKIDEATATTNTYVLALQADLDASQAENARLRESLAEALTEAPQP